MKGDQFAPIDKPYMKQWRKHFDDTQPWEPGTRPTKELDKVVAQIKKGALPKKKKSPLSGAVDK